MFDPLVGKNSLEEGVETYSSILASVHSGQRAAVYGVTKCQTELKQLSMHTRTQKMWVYYKFICQSGVPTKRCHLSSTSTKIKSLAGSVADLQHILKGVQGGDQE